MAWRFVVIFVIFTLQGCVRTQPPQSPVVIPERKPATQTRIAKKITPPHIVILVSEDIPAYSEVAKALVK